MENTIQTQPEIEVYSIAGTPSNLKCSQCNTVVLSNVINKNGAAVTRMSKVICLAGICFPPLWLGFCFIPYCMKTMSDSDEMESFEINDEDIRRAHNPHYKKNKSSKEKNMLGIWADYGDEDDDEDEQPSYRNKTKPSTINFVPTSATKDNKPKETSKNSETSSDESDEQEEKKKMSKSSIDQIILQNLEHARKEREPKPFIRKHSVFSKKIAEPQQPVPRKSYHNDGRKADHDIGTWEKHTKGIGQKLMEKMGWEKGKGIGKELQGRAVPVEAVVRKGKGAVGAYGVESHEVKLQRKKLEEENEEEEDESGFRQSHISQWKKDKHKKLSYNTTTADQLLEMAANNPKKLRKIEETLDLADQKSRKKEINVNLATSKIKIIDMTGKEQRVTHGYESISQINRQNFPSEKKADKLFDLPELNHNLELLINLNEDKLLSYDKKIKHTQDVIVNLEYEEKRAQQRVKAESEQLTRLTELMQYIEQCEQLVQKQNITIEELVEAFQDLQSNYSDEFIIFNLSDLSIPIFIPVIKRKMNLWSPFEPTDAKEDFNELLYCYDIFSDLKLFLNESNINRSNQINPYHRIIWETFMPSFRRIISAANIRTSASKIVDLITNWSSLIPKWIIENIHEQIMLPKLKTEVESWNPLTDTVPIHKWIHPWLPLMKSRLDTDVSPHIRFKLSAALVNWHPSDVSAKAILLPWRPPAFSSNDWDIIMVRNIMPKLDTVLNEELEINPNEQNLEVWHWVMAWFDLIPIDQFVKILERNFFPKWLQVLTVWLNSKPDYNEVSKWYVGWKSLFNEKLSQHPSVKVKLTQGLQMMSKSVSGATVSYQQTSVKPQVPTTSNIRQQQLDESKLLQSATVPTISSFKDLIERKAAEHGILFVQVPNKLKEGKQVYRFGNLNIYIDRNVVFMLQNGAWIPASINEIIQKAL